MSWMRLRQKIVFFHQGGTPEPILGQAKIDGALKRCAPRISAERDTSACLLWLDRLYA